jgi:glycosyltransferase involved in cell wall biosynthesis
MNSSKNKYKCSIFCSFYKGAMYIDHYIANVLEQNIFSDIEFLFLDCCSPENEKYKILPLTEKYQNIKYFRLNKDPGLYAGWNEAVKLCSSDIIGNWNIDDRKPSNGIEILLNELISNPSLDMVYGINYISHIANETYEQNSKDKSYPCYEHSIEKLLQHNSPHCMPLWRKRIHNKLGLFNEKYQTVSDAAMWLFLAVTGGKIKMVDQPVGLYYWNPIGRSTDPNNKKLNHDEITEVKNQIIHMLQQKQNIKP